MVDSGAFSAWSRGERIELAALSDAFASLLDSYSDCCEFVLINLDVVPGSKSVDPSPDEVACAMNESQDNFVRLNRRFEGLVLPVYHQEEPQGYFERLAFECGYIALSPRNDLHEVERLDFVKEVENGPLSQHMKFHGLATTGLAMMSAIRWESVDSATWIHTAANGNIFWYVGTEAPRPLPISSRSPKREQGGYHFDNHSDAGKRSMLEVIETRGYVLSDLQTSDTARYKWNAEVWLDLQ